jgi:hypothetical protein
VDLVARILALVPPWVRIYRIQRDIPMPLVTSGVEKGARPGSHEQRWQAWQYRSEFLPFSGRMHPTLFLCIGAWCSGANSLA